MEDSSSSEIIDGIIHSAELSYAELFRRLDRNHDGHIDVQELIDLLEQMGVEASAKDRVAMARVSRAEAEREDRAIFLFFCFLAHYQARKRLIRSLVDVISTIRQLCAEAREETEAGLSSRRC